MIILEAAACVVLPDNGLPWRKLRENDFSDVELRHLSDELSHVLVHLLSSDPSSRTTIEDLVAHPVISKLASLRSQGLKIERSHTEMRDLDEVEENAPMAKGAVVEEEVGFLQRVFAEVRHAWHSPKRGRPAVVPDENAARLSMMMDVDMA